jgi:hypothetical protein
VLAGIFGMGNAEIVKFGAQFFVGSSNAPESKKMDTLFEVAVGIDMHRNTVVVSRILMPEWAMANLVLRAVLTYSIRASVPCLGCLSFACGDTTGGSTGVQPDSGSPSQGGVSEGGSDGVALSREGGTEGGVTPAGDGASDGGPRDGAPVDGGSSNGGFVDAASTDGGASDGGSIDAPWTDSATFSCAAPPSDLASCATTNDCGIAAKGCYCGQELEYGVATKYLAAQAACEQAAASGCALGCANFPGHMAQDGHSDIDGGTISVRCAAGDGGALTCLTFVQ